MYSYESSSIRVPKTFKPVKGQGALVTASSRTNGVSNWCTGPMRAGPNGTGMNFAISGSRVGLYYTAKQHAIELEQSQTGRRLNQRSVTTSNARLLAPQSGPFVVQ
jgi:hypothetical protein